MASTLWVATAGEDGELRGIVTANNEGILAVKALKQWYGSRNCGWEIRFKSSGITDLRVEAGYVDAVTAAGTRFVNSLSTPSFNTVAEGAIAAFDNVSATTLAGLYCATALAAGAQKKAYTATLAADTYQTWRVQHYTGNAALVVDGQPVASTTGLTAPALDGTAGMVWGFNVTGNASTSNTIDWDYVELWKGRNG